MRRSGIKFQIPTSQPPEKIQIPKSVTVLELNWKKHGSNWDSAQRAVRSVRQAITRFYRQLLISRNRDGKPPPILHPFAMHLEKHLITPSAPALRTGQYPGPGARSPAASRTNRLPVSNEHIKSNPIASESCLHAEPSQKECICGGPLLQVHVLAYPITTLALT